MRLDAHREISGFLRWADSCAVWSSFRHSRGVLSGHCRRTILMRAAKTPNLGFLPSRGTTCSVRRPRQPLSSARFSRNCLNPSNPYSRYKYQGHSNWAWSCLLRQSVIDSTPATGVSSILWWVFVCANRLLQLHLAYETQSPQPNRPIQLPYEVGSHEMPLLLERQCTHATFSWMTGSGSWLFGLPAHEVRPLLSPRRGALVSHDRSAYHIL